MSQNQPSYDLEERSFQFAKAVRLYTKQLPRTIANIEDIKQVVRSSGSVGANYIEANENIGRKDLIMRAKISRKEAKESAFWLRMIYETNDKAFEKAGIELRNEAIELKKIFSAIIKKLEI